MNRTVLACAVIAAGSVCVSCLFLRHELKELRTIPQTEAESSAPGFTEETPFLPEPEPSVGKTLTIIDYDGYRELLRRKESFLLEVSRVTCPYCVNLAYILKDADSQGLDMYILDLEDLRGTDPYDEVKEEFGIDYVPTLFYVEEGKVRYCMNSPLREDLSSVGTNAERDAVRKRVLSEVERFILGAAGKAAAVNEAPARKETTEIPADEATGTVPGP